MELVSIVGKLSDEMTALDTERKNVYESKSKMHTQYDVNNQKLTEREASISVYERALKEYASVNLSVYNRAIEDYDKHIQQGGTWKEYEDLANQRMIALSNISKETEKSQANVTKKR